MSGHLHTYGEFRKRETNQGCMPVDRLDGLLTAIALTPESVEPVEYIPLIWSSEPPDFASADEEQVIFDGIYARIFETAQIAAGGRIEPIFDEEGEAKGWAAGFSQGMNLRPWAWDPMFEADDTAQLLMPIVVQMDDADGLPPTTVSGRSIEEVRSDAAKLIPAAVTAIDMYFEKQRRRGEAAKSSAKVGRNEPCPCGSAKKYKKCCLALER